MPIIRQAKGHLAGLMGKTHPGFPRCVACGRDLAKQELEKEGRDYAVVRGYCAHCNLDEVVRFQLSEDWFKRFPEELSRVVARHRWMLCHVPNATAYPDRIDTSPDAPEEEK